MRLRTPLGVIAILFASDPSLAQFIPQPPGMHSTIVDRSGGDVGDDFFSDQIRRVLVQPNGQPNARNAIFIFNTCFGGGMLDELSMSLPATLPYHLSSASQHNEVAYGEFSRREAKAMNLPNADQFPVNAFSTFSKGIFPQIDDNPTVTIDTLIQNAIALDANGPLGQGLENPQRLFSTGGQNIMLRDPAATSRHAILWGGDANSDRHFHNIRRMYEGLVSIWGDPINTPGVTISVLFGNGSTNAAGDPLPTQWLAREATTGTLRNVIDALVPIFNPNEQFLFYATDHGGLIEDTISPLGPPTLPPVFLPPGLPNVPVPASSSGSFLFAMSTSTTNTPAAKLEAIPAVAPPPGGITGNFSVQLNGIGIGSLDASGLFTLSTFPFDESILNLGEGGNTFSFTNNFNVPIVIPYLSLYSGGIEEQVAIIPEPMAVTLAAPLLMRRSRRRSSGAALRGGRTRPPFAAFQPR